MLISLDWIKDFVKVPDMDPIKLGEKFTLGTAEVEEVNVIGDHWEKIRVAQVTEINSHPNAEKLNLVTFKVSESEIFEVVCGARNVEVGMKTPYAPTGTLLPNGLLLEPKKIRGVLSSGMLCSEEELGLAESSEGILKLPKDAPLGEDLLTYFKESKDVIIDIDNKSLTHRPDLWGHFGLAREFSAIFETPLENKYNDQWKEKLKAKIKGGDSPLKPEVRGESAGIGYFGLSLDNVKVESSPQWIQRRLQAVGLRPINNIVDISNYVMLELGIPLHIFDREKISGDKVIIEAIKEPETFTTLDEIDRKLIPGDTVIRDVKETLVLGGIMGGLNSGVTNSTSKIFIEVANWKAAPVRKTSTRLGLRTDSSQRYEKTLDTQLLERTLFRTLDLVLELCPEAEIIGDIEYSGIDLSKHENLKLETSVAKINKVLGHEVSKERIVSIFKYLDYGVEENGDQLTLTVPSYRSTKDIEYEADLIEEIGRIVGYDNITPISPQVSVTPAKLSSAQKLHRKIKDFMCLHGKSLEVMTYPMVGPKLLKKAQWEYDQEITILNALSVDHDRMRSSLIPSLLESLALNGKNYSELKCFELGRSYVRGKKEFSEDRNQVGIVFYSKEKSTFLDLLNTVERLMEYCNISGQFAEKNPKFKNPLVPEEWPGLHPQEYLNLRLMGKFSGVCFSVHPIVLKQFKIKGHASMAILDLTDFEERPLKEKVKYRPLPKYPNSTFDCTVVAEKKKKVESIFNSLKKVKLKELDSIKIVDVFDLNDEQKTITIRSTFSDPEKTLSGEFIHEASDIIVKALETGGFPLKS